MLSALQRHFGAVRVFLLLSNGEASAPSASTLDSLHLLVTCIYIFFSLSFCSQHAADLIFRLFRCIL